MSQRKIIHLDADCFFAAVEMLDQPAYAQQPLAVGGESDRRGVIATCNYPARAFGIHSAMSTRVAKQRCPQLIVVPPRFDRYKAVSKQIFNIYRRYSTHIEPLSLDEAYLDVTQTAQQFGSATAIAMRIRQDVFSEVGITVSAGVAHNKCIAKIASDHNKPNGLTVVKPHQALLFLHPLSVSKLFGVGPKMVQKLAHMQVLTVGDLYQVSLLELNQRFGNMGAYLYTLARGEDHRPVKARGYPKRISVEHTLSTDLRIDDSAQPHLQSLYARLHQRWQQHVQRYPHAQIKGIHTTIRLSTFERKSMDYATAHFDLALFEQQLHQLRLKYAAAIRLVGIGLSLSPLSPAEQLSFLE